MPGCLLVWVVTFPAQDMEAKTRLITGKRVTLAEEIEVLRHLQSKLDAFTKQLKKEGKLR